MVTKEEILEYVMKTPENTNRAVLESLLNGFGGDYNNYTGEVEYASDSKIPDPSDPVLILYPRGASEEIIGSLAGGDEDEAIIKTGGCIVPGDITVRYAAPAEGPVFVPFTFVDTAETLHSIITYPAEGWDKAAVMIYQNVDGQLYTQSLSDSGKEYPVGILLLYNELSTPKKYQAYIYIECATDALNVTLNDTPANYDQDFNFYVVSIDTAIYPVSGYTLTITDKQV